MKVKKALKFILWELSFIVLLSTFIFSKDAQAANYYASPDGSGSSCSISNPCSVSTLWGNGIPGDVLYLLDGVYRGSGNMIHPPSSLDGRSGQPITIKALNDGKVSIDGQGLNTPVRLSGNDYIILEGFNAYNSSGYVVNLVGGSDHNIVRRVVAWDANTDGNNHIYGVYQSSDNLFEDVAGWGAGRKIFGLQTDVRTTFRRCFFRWSGHSGAGGSWRVGLTHGYRSDRTTVENCIGTWDRASGSSSGEDYAIFGGDGRGGSSYNNGIYRSYGNIGYFTTDQTGPLRTVFGGVRDLGPFDIKDNVMYTNVDGVLTQYLSTNSKIDAEYLTSLGGSFSGLSSSVSLSKSVTNPSISSLGGDILQYRKTTRPSSGAWLRNRYINGILTSQPLWPWPMNDRIKKAMVDSGYASRGGVDGKDGVDVTKTVFELGGGTMPDFSGGGEADTIPPGPAENLKTM